MAVFIFTLLSERLKSRRSAATKATTETRSATRSVWSAATESRSWSVSMLLGKGIFTSKEIKAVYDMNHSIAVYIIIIGVAALHGIHGSAEITHVLQYVIKLQRHTQGISLQEALAHLCIPYQFICIGSSIIAPTGILMQVCRYTHIPRQIDIEVSSIRELPRVKIIA